MSGERLPEGWVETPLENIVEILDSMRIPVNNKERQKRIEGKDFNKLYPYYGATGEVGKIDDFIFDEELIALGEDGVPFFDGQKNKAYMLYGKTWVNNHAHVLRAIQGLSHNKFLCYFLNRFDYHDYVNGGTRLKLTQANMRKIPVRFAPFSEQKIIAEKLDTLLAQVDSTKARLEQIPQILKRFRQAVLTISINGKLTEMFRAQHKLKDVWVEMPLEQLACSDKYSFGIGPFGSNLKVDDYKEEGHPLIFVRDIRARSFGNRDTRYVESSKFEELRAHRAKPGDLLITKMGEPPGDVAIYPYDCEEAVITADCIKLRVNNEIAISKFMLFTMMSNEFREKVVDISAGVAQQKVNLKNFRKLQINVPSLLEQHEIVRRVEQLFAYADAIEKQVNNALTRVNNLTQSILAKAFRGELTAQWRAENPDLISGENSATALLEKIKAERAASGGKKTSRKKA